MFQMKIRLVGTSPLVLHNNRLANPLDEIKKKIATYTSKRKKTDADHHKIAELEFVGGLYFNKQGPYVPSMNLRKMLIEGGRKDKLGKQFESGVYVLEDAAIEYDGPRDVEGMWKDGRFAWTTAVGNQRSTVFRTRPRFEEWAINFLIECDEDFLSVDDVTRALKRAERGVGICDARAIGCGRFSAELLEVTKQQAA